MVVSKIFAVMFWVIVSIILLNCKTMQDCNFKQKDQFPFSYSPKIWVNNLKRPKNQPEPLRSGYKRHNKSKRVDDSDEWDQS